MEILDRAIYDEAPYFHATRRGGTVVARGVATCSLGHRVAGPAADGKPDGAFADWRWDGRRLTIENDPFGMYPVFYAASEDEVWVSSSLVKLLAEGVSSCIDWPALAVFLRLGFYVGDDTAFKAIRVLSPDGRVEWENGQTRVTGGYVFPKPQRITHASAVEGFAALFAAAVERRVPDHDSFAVPLSGGRDSRHILLELAKQGHLPKFCITGRRFPPAGREDERIAALIADRLGIEHVVVGPPAGQIQSQLHANVKTHMTAPRRAWKLAVAEHLHAAVRASYDGIGGDMLSGAAPLDARHVSLMEAGRYRDYARLVFRKG